MCDPVLFTVAVFDVETRYQKMRCYWYCVFVVFTCSAKRIQCGPYCVKKLFMHTPKCMGDLDTLWQCRCEGWAMAGGASQEKCLTFVHLRWL